MLSAPYHPATNGEAEGFVQTFKDNMKTRRATKENVFQQLQKFLLTHRTTEHATTGQTPSNILFECRIRIKMDLLFPNFQAEQNNREYKQAEKHAQNKNDEFKLDDKVLVRMYQNKDIKWLPGVITEKLGSLNYEVEVSGMRHRRHRDQLRSTEIVESFRPAEPELFQLEEPLDQIVPPSLVPHHEIGPEEVEPDQAFEAGNEIAPLPIQVSILRNLSFLHAHAREAPMDSRPSACVLRQSRYSYTLHSGCS